MARAGHGSNYIDPLFRLWETRWPSGSRGPGSSPGWVIVLCSWARHFTLTVPLSTQEVTRRIYQLNRQAAADS